MDGHAIGLDFATINAPKSVAKTSLFEVQIDRGLYPCRQSREFTIIHPERCTDSSMYTRRAAYLSSKSVGHASSRTPSIPPDTMHGDTVSGALMLHEVSHTQRGGAFQHHLNRWITPHHCALHSRPRVGPPALKCERLVRTPTLPADQVQHILCKQSATL